MGLAGWLKGGEGLRALAQFLGKLRRHRNVFARAAYPEPAGERTAAFAPAPDEGEELHSHPSLSATMTPIASAATVQKPQAIR